MKMIALIKQIEKRADHVFPIKIDDFFFFHFVLTTCYVLRNRKVHFVFHKKIL